MEGRKAGGLTRRKRRRTSLLYSLLLPRDLPVDRPVYL